jgi:hypothetical protein
MLSAKVIKPHTPFKAQVFRDELRAETEKISKEIKADFEKTTKTWEHKPKFDVKTKSTNEQVSIAVSTKDKVYGYVDQGTRPHIIKPRRAKRLAFSSKFKPKTKVRVIGSQAGARGKVDTFAQVVHHPGSDAREFAQEIQAAWQPKLKKRIEQTITRAAKKSGHSIK